MSTSDLNSIAANTVHDIEHIIESVTNRGYLETEREFDPFDTLRTRKEFRDLITSELYEAYFLPDRHEFDWAIVDRIVDLATNVNTIEFIKLSIAGGVVGNAAYELLKYVLGTVVKTAKHNKMRRTRWEPYGEMIADLDKIREFFDCHEAARIHDIESETEIPREKLYPLLRLLGFSHFRRTTKTCLWCRPNTHEGLGR